MTNKIAQCHLSKQVIIFTDLDGTLLDHHTYDYSPAIPALKKIQSLEIPLILTSSKTSSEIFDLQNELQITYPAITENGGGVWLPQNQFPESKDLPVQSISYEKILTILNEMPSSLRSQFDGFCDWSTEEVAQKTGLPLEAAKRAATRQWSIPGLWNGTDQDFEKFAHYITSQNLKITRGGRFTHIMGNTSKGDMLLWLKQLYQKKNVNKTILTIALGDAPNDRSMLEVADYSFIIPNVKGEKLEILPEHASGKIAYAKRPGPEGWNDSILTFLNELEL